MKEVFRGRFEMMNGLRRGVERDVTWKKAVGLRGMSGIWPGWFSPNYEKDEKDWLLYEVANKWQGAVGNINDLCFVCGVLMTLLKTPGPVWINYEGRWIIPWFSKLNVIRQKTFCYSTRSPYTYFVHPFFNFLTLSE